MKSNIKLVSNVMLKSRYVNDSKGAIYVPYEILPKSLRDVRNMHNLTKQQEIQMEKYLFRAKK